MGNKKKRKVIILAILLLLLVSGVVLFFVPVQNVTYKGNEKVSEEELDKYLFENKWADHLLVMYFQNQFGDKKIIPFVETYDVEFSSLTSVTITVYEKDMIAYVKYMGYNMYFDKDGIVVESSTENFEGIPEIVGLKYDSIVLNSKIPVKREGVFDAILDVTQSVNKYSVKVDKVYLSEKDEIYLYIEDVEVEMGTSEQLNEKMADLRDIYPNLKGKKGTLDMSVYNENGTGYTMKVDKES